MAKIGIYKYENKINHNIYIGQSTNIEKRKAQHLYDATFRPENSTGIDEAIQKYGIENFNFEIIEECDVEVLDEREIYWIDFYNSYHNGYNRTKGGSVLRGEDHPRAILSEEEVWLIREMYKQHIPRRDVFAAFEYTGISPRGFKKVWDCENWPNIHIDVYTEENKEWHKKNIGHTKDQIGLSSLSRAIKQEEIDLMVADYNKGMNIYQIANKYGRDYGVIQKYLSNPVEIKKIKYHGRKVMNVETNQIFSSISAAARWAKCGATTLTRYINTEKPAGTVSETGELAHWIEIT